MVCGLLERRAGRGGSRTLEFSPPAPFSQPPGRTLLLHTYLRAYFTVPLPLLHASARTEALPRMYLSTVGLSLDEPDRAWAGAWTIFKLRLRGKCPIRHCKTALAGTPTAQIPPDIRMCDEMKEDDDAGRNKAANRGPLHSDVEGSPSGPGVAAEVVCTSTFDKW